MTNSLQFLSKHFHKSLADCYRSTVVDILRNKSFVPYLRDNLGERYLIFDNFVKNRNCHHWRILHCINVHCLISQMPSVHRTNIKELK